jgi:micrococcal nuclease
MLLAGVQAPAPSSVPGTTWFTVTRVVDGDTVIVEFIGRVRLIGVDTPESVDRRKAVELFAREAASFTKQLCEGKRVRLEFERRRRDGYDRTLAYVFLEDGTLVNGEIIRQGYGFAYTRFPFRYLDRFRSLEREAREAKRGLWADARASQELRSLNRSGVAGLVMSAALQR